MTPPTKATDNLCRVVRGGAWYLSSATSVRADSRRVFTPWYRNHYFGFRCAQIGARQPVLKVTP